jgi:hypothetical protein
MGDITSRLFQEDNIDTVYSGLFSGQDTAHQAFQLLEKRLDLQIRVLGFLRQVFKRTIHLKPTRKGLQVLGVADGSGEYHIVDECHGLKELITLLTFLYDDTFSVLGIDEPELHLHPQFQRFLLDELRAIAGSPNEKGKKLIFLVTHSPVLLDLRHVRDLSSVIVFSGDGAPPKRAGLDGLNSEQLLKIRQALPSFHATQRELIFSATPILVEGATDSSILLNVATKVELSLGAAGVGIAAMGGKSQLFAFRALLMSLAKSKTRFILDQDAAVDAKVLHALDDDPAVIGHLAAAGSGGRTLSQEAGELVGLLRSYVATLATKGESLGSLKPQLGQVLTDRDLAMALRTVGDSVIAAPALVSELPAAKALIGKFELIRAAARAANVLILKRGPIEAYYASPPTFSASDFQKQQAFQMELDAIWNATDAATLEARYAELIEFVREAGLQKASIGEMAREPVANLVHLLQTEISAGRIMSIGQARDSSRVKTEGYWNICELSDLQVVKPMEFKGTIVVKEELGGERFTFDQNTRAFELVIKKASGANGAPHEGSAGDGSAIVLPG